MKFNKNTLQSIISALPDSHNKNTAQEWLDTSKDEVTEIEVNAIAYIMQQAVKALFDGGDRPPKKPPTP